MLNRKHDLELDEKIEQLVKNGHDTTLSLEGLAAQISSLSETSTLITDKDPLQKQILETLERLEQTATLIRTKSILELLRSQEVGERYNSLNNAHEGTFSWLLGTGSTDDGSDPESSSTGQPEQRESLLQEREGFIRWLETGTKIFHISGKLGSGKSTLMKFICEHPDTQTHLSAWCKGTPAGDPAGKKLIRGKFFFWNEGSRTQKSRLGFIRAILYSILTQSPELEPLLFGSAHGEDVLDFDYAFGRLMTLDNIYADHRIAIFIDALDECGTRTDREQLIKELEVWASLRPHDLKICVSSREPSDVGRDSQAYPRITLQNHNHHGILSFVRDTLRMKDIYIQKAALYQRKAIEKRIARESEGIFLWSKLAVEGFLRNIEYGYDLQGAQRQIAALPKDLDNLFTKVVSNMVAEGCVVPLALIRVVAYSPKPWPLLRLSFLPDYLNNRNFADRDLPYESKDNVAERRAAVNALIHDCQGLIEVRPSLGKAPGDDVVVMAHRSLYEYFARAENERTEPTPGFEALDCLCQAFLAELRFIRHDRHDIDNFDSRTVMRVIPAPGGPLFFGSGFPYHIRETMSLMQAFVQHRWQHETKFYKFLASFVDIYQHMVPGTTDSKFEFFLPLAGRPARIEKVCNDLSLCTQVLAVCNGVLPYPKPDTGDWVHTIMENLPFDMLVNLLITEAGNPEAAVGLIQHVELYLEYGLPLNGETNLPQPRAKRVSHWSSFLIDALTRGERLGELRRLLPVFALLLLHGGDPRTRFEVRPDRRENGRGLGYFSEGNHREDLFLDPVTLIIGGDHEHSTARCDFCNTYCAGTLGQLQRQFGKSFTLTQLLEYLFPFRKGAIVCEMAKWQLTLPGDLPAAEVAEMRRQRFESKVKKQLLTPDAIITCFGGKDLD
ncbi:uncharacterized protein BO66DRAFT_470569 [Aspergillus aculeatinus CBS 121060]|uniref:Uncharacterized protein n=1 Tax=Aspergillus aculeatinus CBS 121060 TaxID=1448322 RepID=A0ACD1HDB5_9EURO|nr:hypothetical protein BO66DRAFT_470569 [Aspergillus aculeatinus CBS 121060]RAH71429.1 hypothetical protein BO66DRAFT_470569 [Aspergillus aculeatinus CBS 121060]